MVYESCTCVFHRFFFFFPYLPFLSLSSSLPFLTLASKRVEATICRQVLQIEKLFVYSAPEVRRLRASSVRKSPVIARLSIVRPLNSHRSADRSMLSRRIK